MCGIFGHFCPNDQPSLDLVDAMARCLAHRGPDGYALYADKALVFGAGRLAIIDLSAPVGPLPNEDGQVRVAFNGEIYNHRALRRQLEAQGHRFQTATDTEVLVHAYEAWGVDFVERLNGMFAFCVYDAPRRRLVLARDRLGEKPLYYWCGPAGEFAFASEMKALLLHPSIRPRLNRAALAAYFTLGYTPPPQTMFADVHKLAAGERLIVSAEGVRTARYWTAQLSPQAIDYEDARRETRRLLEQAVDSRMMSDVAVGAFLSGGVDSSSVVALMQRLAGQPVQTFSVGFDFAAGSSGDEKFNVDLRYAGQVAAALGTQHHAIRLSNQAAEGLLPHLVYHMDEPVAQYSIVQTAYLAGVARLAQVPVLLTGDAGDELFLGYTHYRADQRLAPWLKLPRSLRQAAARALRAAGKGALATKLLNDAPHQRYLEWMRVLRPEEIEPLLDSIPYDQAMTAALDSLLGAPHTPHFADRIAYASLAWWIPEDSNMRVDKMCMAMSLESRAPLEDHRLVEWALRLPLEYKLRHGDFKRIFKDAVRDLLPAEVLSRPKWGFTPPMSDWLRTIYRPLLERWLSPSYVAQVGVCRPQAVARLVDEHLGKRGYHLKVLWALLTFHLWHALFIDGSLALDNRPALELVRASLIAPR
ncbi:MAG: asparagine synthase (glutamine-hydrolyzing) [Anaerolineae bacterium]|nr:asparagine synthase (glutamine-hydrolyzing) [Anaerolineae bacterium]MDW8172959.1 asparagine synthase (glutamine-hydrolyzing) [Anaerolineae bacterium]